MIDFGAFSDEVQKIAQYDPNKKAKLVGMGVGAGAGAAGARKLLRGLPSKVRGIGTALGAVVGGLGGRELGEGAATAGRGLRMTAAQTRYALQ